MYGEHRVKIKKLQKPKNFENFGEYLSTAFYSKSISMGFTWNPFSRDKENRLNNISSIYVKYSTDGYGFKIYKNEGKRTAKIKIHAKTHNMRISKEKIQRIQKEAYDPNSLLLLTARREMQSLFGELAL